MNHLVAGPAREVINAFVEPELNAAKLESQLQNVGVRICRGWKAQAMDEAYVAPFSAQRIPVDTGCKMARTRLMQLMLIVPLLACADLFGPGPPSDAVPLSPIPPAYEGWWSLAEGCVGRQGELSRVRWLVSSGSSSPDHDAAGTWYSNTNTIVLANGRQKDGALVRHEMAHALSRSGSHPRAVFAERCAGIVSCGGRCLEEVGGPIIRDMTASVVDADILEVRVDLAPRVVSLSTETEGCVTVVVEARNSQSMPVRVRLSGGVTRNQSFGWTLEGFRQGAVAEEDSLMPFAGDEARRHVFECVFLGPIRNWESPEPGTHIIRGHLQSAVSDSTPVVVVH